MSPDTSQPDGPLLEQKTRKWYISDFTSNREIVDTAYGLVTGGIIHETAELFLYKGEAINNRHIDPEELVKIARVVDCRDPE